MDGRLRNILIDSFPKILIPGLTMTLPLTAIAFFFVPHDYSITSSMPELLPRILSCLTFGLA